MKGLIKSSVPTTVSQYGVLGSSLVGAVIAAPVEGKRQFWTAIEHGRFFLPEPVPKKVREEMVHQLTLGSSLSRKHAPCVLVKMSTGEMAWVRESEVGPVEQDGKRRTAPPDRYEPGDRSMPPSVPQLRSRGGILEAVEPLDMVMLYDQVKKSVLADSVLVDPQRRTEQVVHQFRSSKAFSNKDLTAASEVLTMSLWYAVVRSNEQVRVAVVDEAFGTDSSLPLNVIDRIIESVRSTEQVRVAVVDEAFGTDPSLPLNVVDHDIESCQQSSSGLERESGSKSDKHRSSQNSKAESGQKRSGRKDQHDRKKTRREYKNCVKCGDTRARHAGSLCKFCFLMGGGKLNKTLCHVCSKHGYKRVAHKRGGRCRVCVLAKAGRPSKPKCVSCGSRKAHYKGKLCWICSHPRKPGDTP